MPKISVIIPVYNSEVFIEQCIQSLKNQSFTDFEAILIDDASTDTSLSRIANATKDDDRFVVIEQTENKGPSATRNIGMDYAKGEYITFLDSDDQFVPSAFRTLYNMATQHELDLIDFAGAPAYETEQVKELWTENIDKRSPIPGVLTGKELFCEYIRLNEYYVALYLHFFRRSLLEEGPLRLEEGIIHEDVLFTPLLHSRAQRAMLLPELLYQRNIRFNSLVTSPRGIYNVRCMFTVITRLETWLQENVNTFSKDYIEALTQYLWGLKKIMAYDILRCAGDELAHFKAGLSHQDYAQFNLIGMQLANEIRELESSKTWKLAKGFANLPKIATRIARKKK